MSPKIFKAEVHSNVKAENHVSKFQVYLKSTYFGGWPKSEVLLILADHRKRQGKYDFKLSFN